MTGGLPDEATWRRRPDVLWRRSLDAVIFLPAGFDEPLTLGGSGPEVWELLAEPRTLEALVTILAAVHAVDPDTIRGDVEPVLARLESVGALDRLDQPVQEGPDQNGRGRRAAPPGR